MQQPSRDRLRDERRRPFYLVDNDLIDQYGAKIGAYGVAVYSLLVRYANANGENAFPSYQTIAKKLNMSRGKAIQTVAELIEAGLITKSARLDAQGDLSSNLYSIVDLAGGSASDELPSTSHELGVVHTVNQGGSPHVPDQDVVTKTPLNKTTTTTAGAVVAVSNSTPLNLSSSPLTKTRKGEANDLPPVKEPDLYIRFHMVDSLGFFPRGAGANPVEVFHEEIAVKNTLTVAKRRSMCETVTDLDLWRRVVKGYAETTHHPTNWAFLKVWYQNGITSIEQWKQFETRNKSHVTQQYSANGASKSSGAQKPFRRAVEV